ncbi:Receptor homology region transmembrane domain-and RING domain-containing protein [Lachnellula suecica]|uniref:RING-type E3 ubiquitin transferase n=1 Tax=Lachnellula suecica TaxID=602035 RepID=A0A8T9BSY9_9HELO|nr:Receptor homology region transmembrane domain-and RING domain-containing protein [Lachnellula suecica]
MATSIVARSMALRTLMFLLVLVLLPAVAYAQTVQPSNLTDPDQVLTQLSLSGGPLFSAQLPKNLSPLTPQVGKNANAVTLKQLNIQGILKGTDASTTTNLTSTDIAYISCDPDGSNIDPSTVVVNAGAVKPKAIVLYSLQYNECNLTGTPSYTSIFSVTSIADAQSLLDTINLYPSNTELLSAMIGSNTTSSAGASASADAQQGGPAPTTAVAMSILYSITGIITLLFLIIIATGAVRAHRHPERYGPRNGYAGRPRQSRAKGLARAMLETLPIVKFGDPEPVKDGSGAHELEEGNGSHAAPAQTTPQQEGTGARSPGVETAAVASGMGAAQEGSKDSTGEAAAVTAPKEGELGCSICTEDFTTGEELRVLPCNHRYHPACIDPWLLNVSATCPLW